MASIPTLVFGGGTIADDGSFTTAADVSSLLETLKSEGITQIDTAQLYGKGTSEQLIGQGKGISEILIDTKHVGGFDAGSSTRKGVFDGAIASLERLGVEKVRITLIYHQTS